MSIEVMPSKGAQIPEGGSKHVGAFVLNLFTQSYLPTLSFRFAVASQDSRYASRRNFTVNIRKPGRTNDS